jgi:hypothetical protein
MEFFWIIQTYNPYTLVVITRLTMFQPSYKFTPGGFGEVTSTVIYLSATVLIVPLQRTSRPRHKLRENTHSCPADNVLPTQSTAILFSFLLLYSKSIAFF